VTSFITKKVFSWRVNDFGQQRNVVLFFIAKRKKRFNFFEKISKKNFAKMRKTKQINKIEGQDYYNFHKLLCFAEYFKTYSSQEISNFTIILIFEFLVFDFWRNVRLFDDNLGFWRKFRFFDFCRRFRCLKKNYIFHENLDFWGKFTKISVCDETFDCWRKFIFLWQKLKFPLKIEIYGKNQNFLQK